MESEESETWEGNPPLVEVLYDPLNSHVNVAASKSSAAVETASRSKYCTPPFDIIALLFGYLRAGTSQK